MKSLSALELAKPAIYIYMVTWPQQQSHEGGVAIPKIPCRASEKPNSAAANEIVLVVVLGTVPACGIIRPLTIIAITTTTTGGVIVAARCFVNSAMVQMTGRSQPARSSEHRQWGRHAEVG
jgi:hypothetical protein